MITTCPHCRKTLKLGKAQQAKLQRTLSELAPGKRLTIKCPSCKRPIRIAANGTSEVNGSTAVQPPAPPDIEWLRKERFQDEEKIEDVPMALLLYPENSERAAVRETVEQVGYQVFIAETVQEARDRMRFVNFACVTLHSRFEGESLEDSSFHAYMREMAMQRRRYIFYILIGPEFHTLYDLQALASSANLVVNERDIKHLDVVLRKAIPSFEELFSPLLEKMGLFGKG
ncbi:hypothetical protein MNBD_DELTA04-1145 [hydrothermal vent metagenome]|uniref:Zinc finger/thioredoxin putative domain-containing protein n=1 Tax=hydrothermal vent metagenome TaxID=652676 RepID=A0A3B0VRV7_9ZZZZ